MKETITVILICALVAVSTTSFAESNPRECAAINDKDVRLACYDKIFRLAQQQDHQSESKSSLTTTSPIDSRGQQEHESLSNWFSITPHRPNYILPASHNFSADYSTYGEFSDSFSDTEVKFQLSLKTMLWPNMWRGSSLWAAYTQQSFWQLYADEEASAPFRETKHEPEIFWQLPVSFSLFGMDARFATLAFNHQSNGRGEPLSRSWNRLTGELTLEKGRFVTSMKSWIRVDNSSTDNNPDIEDFMGRIQVGAAYKGDVHTIAIGLKNNLSSVNRSGVELNWTFPLAQKVKGIVQIYSGYGENLIDMENYSNRVSLGVLLTDWL